MRQYTSCVPLSHAACLVTLLLVVGGCSRSPVDAKAVWSEFLPFADVREQFDTLAEFDVELYVAVDPKDLTEELATLIREGAARGVPVHPWLQLPDNGLWLNEANADAFHTFAINYHAWATSNGVAPAWMIFDIEPGFDYASELRDTATDGDLGAVVDLLLDHRDAETYAEALATVRAMVADLHARDARVMAVALPWVLDDLGDADADIQDVTDMPVFGVDWDRVSLMVYRPFFADLLGRSIPPGLVARYAEELAVRYGDGAEIAIGTIAAPGLLSGMGYLDPEQIRLDVEAARSGGVRRVSIFSLDGMLDAGGARRWLEAASQATPDYSHPDPISSLVRFGLGVGDCLLDSAEP